MQDMILFPEDIDLLNTTLDPLVKKADLLLAVLINKDGRLLTYRGEKISVDIVALSALIAGNSSSTLAIANLMGEHEFCTMYHQGKNKHIYISNVDDHTFLAIVFNDNTNIDRVKVFVRQFDKQIKKSLNKVYDKTLNQIDLDLDISNHEFEALSEPKAAINEKLSDQDSNEKGGDDSEKVFYYDAPVPQKKRGTGKSDIQDKEDISGTPA